ncbi:hypothetical protein BLNAU_14840 [Blattamonas nauphoetae]|uniref:Transcription factor Pcc1 n=1 Tax=Blattamonas nauphoetae TaxID=2049346 RepID=A0ABQ9XCL7_9EUKA|nr:hypothetical protein BLNAU_14840 [Blattamonas nauphoetae]
MTQYQCTVSMRTLSEEHAAILARALSVEPDINPERSSRIIVAEGSLLKATFIAQDAKSLRTIVSNNMDLFSLALQAIALGIETTS